MSRQILVVDAKRVPHRVGFRAALDLLTLFVGVKQPIDRPSRVHLRGLNCLVNCHEAILSKRIQINWNASQLAFDTNGQLRDLDIPIDDIYLGIDIERAIRQRTCVSVCHRLAPLCE